MAFPSNPTNGATYVSNGVTYTFNSATSQWIGALPTSSGGGGSMGAPTHFGRFTLSTNFTAAQHTGGTANGYISGSIIGRTLNTGDNTVQIYADTANYGTGIALSGTVELNPQFIANAPQFCSDAAFLASNPTYFGEPATQASYYCAATGVARVTRDSGATFSNFPETPNGKIKLAIPGKYKVKVKHICETENINPSYVPIIHTLIFVDNVLKANCYDKAGWEYRTDSVNNLMSRMRTEFDTIIETTTANAQLTLGLGKLGGTTTTATSNAFVVTIESLF